MTNKRTYALLLAAILAGMAVPAAAEDAEDAASSQADAAAADKLQDNMMTDLPPVDRAGTIALADEGILYPPSSGSSIIRDTTAKKAEEKPKTKTKMKDGKPVQDTGISKENPMYVTADYMRYNDTTGDVDALGKVDIRHMMDTYQTEYLYGNMITKKYVIPGELTWTNPQTNLKAQRGEYDAEKGIGKFEGLTGWQQGTYYYQGSDGIYDRNANKMIVNNGYFTTRHAVAKVPDYRIEADSIDIYPGDHYTAHEVKLMAKNTILLTLSSYTGSLKDNSGEIGLWSLIPRPVFDSDNGMGLHNSLVIPINEDPDSTVYMENRWYTKSGYKPDIGIKYRVPVGTFRLHYAKEESTTNDDGGIWVKKKPSLEFDTNHFYLFKSRFYVGASGEIGKWDEERNGRDVDGNYKGYELYISGDPWHLGKFMNFGWKAGYAKDYYGYSNNIRRNSYYSMGLSGHYKIFDGWIGYTDRDLKGYTPYYYDSYSSEKPVDAGFRIQATSMDAFSLSWSVDTVNGILNHRYWTYYRDMHSFYAWIRYDDIEKETKFMIMPKDFKF